MEKLHLYLVRHCESLGNRENIFQGQLDLDISATGEKQLALLALRFRNIPIDAVYSSPLKRAYKTAEAVDLYHSLPIIKLPLRYNYDKPEKPRISRVFGYLARFFILFQTEKSSREVVIS